MKALVEKLVGTAAGTRAQVLHKFGGVKLRPNRKQQSCDDCCATYSFSVLFDTRNRRLGDLYLAYVQQAGERSKQAFVSIEGRA